MVQAICYWEAVKALFSIWKNNHEEDRYTINRRSCACPFKKNGFLVCFLMFLGRLVLAKYMNIFVERICSTAPLLLGLRWTSPRLAGSQVLRKQDALTSTMGFKGLVALDGILSPFIWSLIVLSPQHPFILSPFMLSAFIFSPTIISLSCAPFLSSYFNACCFRVPTHLFLIVMLHSH